MKFATELKQKKSFCDSTAILASATTSDTLAINSNSKTRKRTCEIIKGFDAETFYLDAIKQKSTEN